MCQVFVIVGKSVRVITMENPEEVLQSLDEFAKLKPKDIPKELEDYLSYVAKTGDPVYQWSIVKCLFREKLLNVITDFYESSPTIDLPPCPNVDPFNYETMKNSLLERLESFPSAPFTVQRLCELLTTPRKEYSRADKFMRAIEKNILVVSTREPGNVRRSDSNGQSELLMNGVMDGRGIELGEAIETVSSEGVNMMHANENEINVTENENVVTVECGGMEEIDMEEQSENMEATTTSSWDKEQCEPSDQKEENSNEEKVEEKCEGDDKSKDNPSEPDSAEDNNVERVENKDNSELPVVTENDESSEVVPENSNSDSELGSDEKQEVDSTESESTIQSDTSVTEEKTLKEGEESIESNPTESEVSEENPVSEEKMPSEKEAVDSSSVDEDPSNSISSTETAEVDSSNEETVAKEDEAADETCSLIVPNPSESVSEIAVPESDSASSDATSVEICTKDDEASVVENSAEVAEITSAVSTSEVESVEEVSSTKSSADGEEEEVTEAKEELPEQDVAVEQDEAMEVDEALNTELPSADIEEPMDQSEQPTSEQVES